MTLSAIGREDAGSEGVGAAEVSWTAVGIDEAAVEHLGPPLLPARNPLGLVGARASRRAGALTAAGVPLVEGRGGGSPRREPGDRVEEVFVVADVAAEMLAPQSETRIARQHARAITEAGRVARLALVARGVEH